MTQAPYDLVIRGGTVVDGTGGKPFPGDLAVRGGVIAAIGKVEGAGREEIDAAGCIVTPGFIDVHTHYDGQVIWSSRLSPSSSHGVTTVVIGNCGVGFAPCRKEDHELLIRTMEGVEDIPEVVMAEGLTWDWETFPQYLDAIDRTPHDIDVAALLPHSALRVYVMGERGANREVATDDDLSRMQAVTREAMAAGAVGFATSRIGFHRTVDGQFIPSFEASERELQAIADEVAKGRGILQLVPELIETTDESKARELFDLLCRLSRESGARLTFTHGQMAGAAERFPKVVEWAAAANREAGVAVHPQMFCRAVGMYVGLELTANPFSMCPSYEALADLPLDQRVAEMRKPELRERLIAEEPRDPDLPMMAMARRFDRMFPMADNPFYEPDLSESVAGIAQRQGRRPEEVAYDLILERDGRAKLHLAWGNYFEGSLDFVEKAVNLPDVILGLGDGGAHYGLICDSSYPTFMLSYWARDRKKPHFSVEEVVAILARKPAELMGFTDRGVLEVGRKADINVIAFDRLRLFAPEVRYDLPAGGKRIDQAAQGYRATIVSGEIILRNDQPTGALPGRLVRGGSSHKPASTAA